MDGFEFNKIAGAILGTALGVMAVGTVAELIYEPPHPEQRSRPASASPPGATPGKVRFHAAWTPTHATTRPISTTTPVSDDSHGDAPVTVSPPAPRSP